MSGAEYFSDSAAINPYMDASVPVDVHLASQEHSAIRLALEGAGVAVTQVPPPENAQDGIYTANWALIRGDTAILARLPNAREVEEAYAERYLRALGKTVLRAPESYRFSGQGDALPCGEYLFAGMGYRSEPEAQQFAAETLGYKLIQLQTIPELDAQNQPVINSASGWPDSFFYDIDLALSVLKQPDGEQKGLIGWCPDAFTPESRAVLESFDSVDKIELSFEEATKAFAANLVSTGETVIMNAGAPNYQAAIEAHGLKVITLRNPEIGKGGGSIRCTTLTLDN